MVKTYVFTLIQVQKGVDPLDNTLPEEKSRNATSRPFIFNFSNDINQMIERSLMSNWKLSFQISYEWNTVRKIELNLEK